MPRVQPAPGYVTAHEAMEMLGATQGVLARYVQEGRLKRYGPPERKHKFYKRSEIEAVIAARHMFEEEYRPGQWRSNPSSLFSQAQEADMTEIVRISTATFQDAEHPKPMTPPEIRVSWLRKNPETFYVLRNQAGTIVGYASFLPLPQQIIDRFIQGDIEMDDITAEDVETFTPGRPYHLYLMAVCVDPACSTAEKHEYGSRLISGLFAVLLDLAQRGIEIETITARSRKTDGIRLLRKIGIPQLISPVLGLNLYAIRIAESGLPILTKYRELLAQWKQRMSTEPTS